MPAFEVTWDHKNSLVLELQKNPFRRVLVLGPTGSGKSSFVATLQLCFNRNRKEIAQVAVPGAHHHQTFNYREYHIENVCSLGDTPSWTSDLATELISAAKRPNWMNLGVSVNHERYQAAVIVIPADLTEEGVKEFWKQFLPYYSILKNQMNVVIAISFMDQAMKGLKPFDEILIHQHWLALLSQYRPLLTKYEGKILPLICYQHHQLQIYESAENPVLEEYALQVLLAASEEIEETIPIWSATSIGGGEVAYNIHSFT